MFSDHPDWFWVDESGERVADANMCASSAEALAYVGERGVELSRMLTPTTGRYY